MTVAVLGGFFFFFFSAQKQVTIYHIVFFLQNDNPFGTRAALSLRQLQGYTANHTQADHASIVGLTWYDHKCEQKKLVSKSKGSGGSDDSSRKGSGAHRVTAIPRQAPHLSTNSASKGSSFVFSQAFSLEVQRSTVVASAGSRSDMNRKESIYCIFLVPF